MRTAELRLDITWESNGDLWTIVEPILMEFVTSQADLPDAGPFSGVAHVVWSEADDSGPPPGPEWNRRSKLGAAGEVKLSFAHLAGSATSWS